MMNENVLLFIENIDFSIGEKSILQDVSLSIHSNEIVTLIGPNGAGKSTLLSIALGLKKPTNGAVHLQKNLRIGYVPQLINRDATMPMTVRDFVSLSRASVSTYELNTLFQELDLTRLTKSHLSDLSGGELRRVLLLRAVLNKPDLLILDEPTAGIDAAGQVKFYERLTEWRARQRFAILMVSHDLHLVMSATDRVVCLNQHICCHGAPTAVMNDKQYLSLFGHANHAPTPPLSFYQHRDEVPD